MREQYDLKSLKVKRRGPLPGLGDRSDRQVKLRITIALDREVVEHFKTEAAKPGALPYQTQINQALRRVVAESKAPGEVKTEAVKKALIEDGGFVRVLAGEVRAAMAAAPK